MMPAARMGNKAASVVSLRLGRSGTEQGLKSRRIILAVATVGLVLIALAACAGYAYLRIVLATDATRPVGATAAVLVDSARVPAISYVVIESGAIAATATLGIADVERATPATDRTLFEAASLTKPVVAEIARRLYREGVYDLDEPVARTLESPRIRDQEAWLQVTPRQLLSHTSGLPNWSGDPSDPERQDALEFEFPPGTAFRYSGEGYGILLAFLETKSGIDARTLSQALFTELGMHHSTLVGADASGPFARGHWGTAPDRPARRTAMPVAAFSMLTNAAEYGRFLEHVIAERRAPDDDPFGEITVHFASHTRNGCTESLGWSLGWGTLERCDGTIYFQWGDNGAFRAFAAFEPGTGNGIAYFANGSYGTLYADALSRPVLGDIGTAQDWFASPWLELIQRLSPR